MLVNRMKKAQFQNKVFLMYYNFECYPIIISFKIKKIVLSVYSDSCKSCFKSVKNTKLKML